MMILFKINLKSLSSKVAQTHIIKKDKKDKAVEVEYEEEVDQNVKLFLKLKKNHKILKINSHD